MGDWQQPTPSTTTSSPDREDPPSPRGPLPGAGRVPVWGAPPGATPPPDPFLWEAPAQEPLRRRSAPRSTESSSGLLAVVIVVLALAGAGFGTWRFWGGGAPPGVSSASSGPSPAASQKPAASEPGIPEAAAAAPASEAAPGDPSLGLFEVSGVSVEESVEGTFMVRATITHNGTAETRYTLLADVVPAGATAPIATASRSATWAPGQREEVLLFSDVPYQAVDVADVRFRTEGSASAPGQEVVLGDVAVTGSVVEPDTDGNVQVRARIRYAGTGERTYEIVAVLVPQGQTEPVATATRTTTLPPGFDDEVLLFSDVPHVDGQVTDVYFDAVPQ